MTAPLCERLAEAAKAAHTWPWVTEPREGHHIYTDHRDENGNGIQCPAIGIHPDHSPWQETKDFILLAQPANVAKLCEQVRVMKEALQALLDNGGIGPESMFDDALYALKMVNEQ